MAEYALLILSTIFFFLDIKDIGVRSSWIRKMAITPFIIKIRSIATTPRLKVLFSVVGFCIGFYKIYTDNFEKSYAKWAGEMLSSKLETVDIRVNVDGANFISNQGVLDFKERIDSTMDFKVTLVNQRIKIFSTIRNSSGEIICQINNNEWLINPNNMLDRNFDERGVEILNKNGDVVLQLDNRDDGVHAMGIFYGRYGNGSAILPASIFNHHPGSGCMMLFLRKGDSNVHYSVKRIFKYPSDLHKGERVEE